MRRIGFRPLFISLALVGCQGAIEDASHAGRDFEPPPMVDARNPVRPPDASPTAAPSPMARLTPTEIARSINDVFQSALDSPVPEPDRPLSGASIDAYGAVDALSAFQSALAVADALDLSHALFRCDADGTERRTRCTEQLVRDYGLRIFRRPVEDDELQRYTHAAASEPTYEDGLRVVFAAMLGSPHFLYRPEIGDPDRAADGYHPLTDYEMAAKLSYALWDSTPDDTLLAAAAAGELRTPAQIESQVRRLLEAPRGREVVRQFHYDWLAIGAVEGVFLEPDDYPEFDDEMPARWTAETESFVTNTIFEGDGSLETLFTASHTFGGPELAALYEATAPGSDMRIELGSQRAGVLTQGAVLAGHAPDERNAPIHRGVFVYRELLCGELSNPPPNVPPLPEPDPAASLRDQITTATSVEPCAGCHSRFNAYGFALGVFDAVAAYRDQDDNGHPVDPVVELTGPGDLAGVAVDGPVSLGRALAESAALRDCYIDRWFQYLTGRSFDVAAGDGHARSVVQYEFEIADRHVLDMLAKLMSSAAFRYVAPVE